MWFSSPIKIAHKVKMKRHNDAFGSKSKKWKPIKLTHKFRLKPLKALKKMFGFWM
jgi:hypothetical protein